MFISQEDLNRSVFSLIKNNNGLFKSLGQYKVLSSFHAEYSDGLHHSDKTGILGGKDDPQWNSVVKHEGGFFMLEGYVNWSGDEYANAGRGGMRWSHLCFFDGKGITGQYKIKYVGNMRDGMAPKSISLVWERPAEVEGEDFGAAVQVAKQEREVAEKERLDGAAPLKEGRYEFQGIVKSTKIQDGYYNTEYKMLVELDDGNRLYGTVPSSIDFEDLKGKRIKLTGKVMVKEAGFGFFSRPSKAELL